MSETKTRLKAEDWILAGFRALASQGPDALKAEPLARALKTTKGSFYWHFKDVPDFHKRMLALWEEQSVDAITQELSLESDPVKRLYQLGDIAVSAGPEYGGDAAEPAIRAWAYGNPIVSQAVQRVDQKRVAFLNDILSELDLTNPDIARIIYGAYVGMGTLSASDTFDNKNAMSTLMAAILALRDA
ncbi:TetR/AcrR family transcriptional regulator [Aliiroseovarius sp. S1339]|uniref:TetR/AcrR family transcriptional regulator n=1 Tax=Aliiroseovarius sp. S1339 TaxID=2936990 RepID=UPI0020BEB49D|nr:TetR/AcrR family transcriptional regulator [Aliiroseovarius sp. S1339]MCK8463903.1 TetR/AcrR family transcriptional regulator [Aliiroseovarius sp. S1339]